MAREGWRNGLALHPLYRKKRRNIRGNRKREKEARKNKQLSQPPITAGFDYVALLLYVDFSLMALLLPSFLFSAPLSSFDERENLPLTIPSLTSSLTHMSATNPPFLPPSLPTSNNSKDLLEVDDETPVVVGQLVLEVGLQGIDALSGDARVD